MKRCISCRSIHILLSQISLPIKNDGGVLTLDGKAKLCELYDEPSSPVNPCRIVFFIYKCGGKILHTPYGDFPLTDTEETPKQLKKIVEFEEED